MRPDSPSPVHFRKDILTMPDTRPNLYLLRAADIAARSQTFSHPWNERSEISGYQLGKSTGLRRTGVNLARLAPGKESFVYHAHWMEEEWIYVLSGRGVARIDGADYEVGAGDFMAFPTPGVAHHLRNPFASELLYLMGEKIARSRSRTFRISASACSDIRKVSRSSIWRTHAPSDH